MRKIMTLAVLCLVFAATLAPTRRAKAESAMIESGSSCTVAITIASAAFAVYITCRGTCTYEFQKLQQANEDVISACS